MSFDVMFLGCFVADPDNLNATSSQESSIAVALRLAQGKLNAVDSAAAHWPQLFAARPSL
eukprot:SAG31_NODE_1193_length_9454_cov_38.779156_6_plen_60_part_00